MLESAIVRQIMVSARSRGWWIVKIHGGPHQVSGLPDLLCLKGGVAVWLEVKQPGKRATPIQMARMAEIERVGAVMCHVVTSREQAEEILEGIEK